VQAPPPHVATSLGLELEVQQPAQRRAEELGAGELRGCGARSFGAFKGFSGELGARPSSLDVLETVGSGAKGTVFKVFNSETGETLALKSPKGSDARRACSSPSSPCPHSAMRHENVVQLKGSSEDGSIVMEFVDGRSLADVIGDEGEMSEVGVRRLVVEILRGLRYLHDRGVVHSDLKPANVLIDKASGKAKIVDIPCCDGLRAELRAGGLAVPQGTPVFMAPETVRTGAHNKSSDIWSFGCLVLNLLTGRLPWDELDNSFAAMFRIGHGEHPSIPSSLSPAATDFLMKCFEPKADLRATAEELLSHDFLASPCSSFEEILFPALSSSVHSSVEASQILAEEVAQCLAPQAALSTIRLRSPIAKSCCGAARQRAMQKGLKLKPLAV